MSKKKRASGEFRLHRSSGCGVLRFREGLSSGFVDGCLGKYTHSAHILEAPY